VLAYVNGLSSGPLGWREYLDSYATFGKLIMWENDRRHLARLMVKENVIDL
jgi:hypothetical protein